MSDSEDSRSSGGKDDFKRVRGPADLQKRRLERLMKNPEKTVHIPEPPKSKPPPAPAEYVRFYMGSSAGAGSGEFHIYRNLRRKEQNRMRYIDEQAKKDDLQKVFAEKVDEQKRLADQKAEKKRAKRRKKKANKGNKKPKSTAGAGQKSAEEHETDSSSSSDADESETVDKPVARSNDSGDADRGTTADSVVSNATSAREAVSGMDTGTVLEASSSLTVPHV